MGNTNYSQSHILMLYCRGRQLNPSFRLIKIVMVKRYYFKSAAMMKKLITILTQIIVKLIISHEYLHLLSQADAAGNDCTAN